jgi:hypothetical protein
MTDITEILNRENPDQQRSKFHKVDDDPSLMDAYSQDVGATTRKVSTAAVNIKVQKKTRASYGKGS